MNTTCHSCLWTGPAYDAHGAPLARCMACGSADLIRDDEEWPDEEQDDSGYFHDCDMMRPKEMRPKEERDPIADPQPGDWFVDPDGKTVRVDAVKNGEVFYAVFKPRADEAYNLIRKKLGDWRESCAFSKVRHCKHGDPEAQDGRGAARKPERDDSASGHA